MPHVSIELHEGVYNRDQRRAISDGIHQAMIDVLAIPEDDRYHYFTEYPVGSVFRDEIAFGIPRTDKLIYITFSFNERTPEVKDALFKAVVDQVGQRAGLLPRDFIIRILETARENWWAEGRLINPETGYDQRMTNVPGSTS